MAPNLNSYLTFQSWAFQRNAQGGHNQRQFSALCGDNPPQITDGYGKWGVIDRPLRQGVTIPQGFNPPRMKVEIRFGIWDRRFGIDGWDTSATAGEEVESNINDLHWMAGLKGGIRGGPSPVIYVDSYSSLGGGAIRTNLVPNQLRGTGWVIDGGVEWGTSYREKNSGSRIFQDASFTLLSYAGLGASAPPQQNKLAGGYFVTNPTHNTAFGVAAADSTRSPEPFTEILAGRICNDPRNNPCRGSRISLERRSIYWQIPTGIAVWVPDHMI